LAGLSESGLPIIVVSNQACVGKGLLEPSALVEITNRFVASLRRTGGRIDAVYYCPHTPEENCDCRKPRGGLLSRAARDWALDLRRSVLIGDSISDVQAASAAGCTPILWSSAGQEQPWAVNRPGGAGLAVDSLSGIVELVRRLLQQAEVCR